MCIFSFGTIYTSNSRRVLNVAVTCEDHFACLRGHMTFSTFIKCLCDLEDVM